MIMTTIKDGWYGLVDKTYPSCVRPGFNTRGATLGRQAGHYPTPAVKGMS